MSPDRVLLVVAAAVVLLPGAAMATEHVVGDAEGWRLGVNYMKWAIGKDFRVGDTLVFKYSKGEHNVYNVTAPDFHNCTVSKNSTRHDSGYDVITLKTPGMKWYICGVAGHCDGGQKLIIAVLPPSPTPSPASLPPFPAPSPTPPADGGPSSATSGLMGGASPSLALAAVAALAAAIAFL